MRIGLSGGIGSGKSTVSLVLVNLGAALIDTDAIARTIAQPGGIAIPAIAEAFGTAAVGPDGGMDRARMREIVFTDRDAKAKLEGILHPLIGAECERLAAEAHASGRPIVFDVPLLVESRRWRAIVDRVLIVDAEPDTQVSRVMSRSGWKEADVRAVIAQQADRKLRRAAADAVIFNEGLSLAELSSEVQALWTEWLGAARDNR